MYDITKMAQGRIIEKINEEMTAVMGNIQDPRTPATAKRRMTVVLTFEPTEERDFVAVTAAVKTALATHSPVITAIQVPMAGQLRIGEKGA